MKRLNVNFVFNSAHHSNLNFLVQHHQCPVFSFLALKSLDLFSLGSEVCQKLSIYTWGQEINLSSVEKNLSSSWRDFNAVQQLGYKYVNRKLIKQGLSSLSGNSNSWLAKPLLAFSSSDR